VLREYQRGSAYGVEQPKVAAESVKEDMVGLCNWNRQMVNKGLEKFTSYIVFPAGRWNLQWLKSMAETTDVGTIGSLVCMYIPSDL
jgi:hypothetical protein